MVALSTCTRKVNNSERINEMAPLPLTAIFYSEGRLAHGIISLHQSLLSGVKIPKFVCISLSQMDGAFRTQMQ